MNRAFRPSVSRIAALLGALALAFQSLGAMPALAASGDTIVVCTGSGIQVFDRETGKPVTSNTASGHCCVAASSSALSAPAPVSTPAPQRIEAADLTPMVSGGEAGIYPPRPPGQGPPQNLKV